jgi:hypothetical protein
LSGVLDRSLVLASASRDGRSRLGLPREGLVKAPGGTVKEASTPPLTSGNGPYEGRMTDVIYVLITLAAFVGLALLVGVLDRPEKH